MSNAQCNQGVGGQSRCAAIPVPNLATLNKRASWVNRAGGVDRSACFEIRASHIWHHIGIGDFKQIYFRNVSSYSMVSVEPYLDATAEYVLTGSFLHDLRQRENARPLLGDLRTRKSNVMKCEQSDAINLPGQTAINPNRGAAGVKILGIPYDDACHTPWRQRITILRWKYPIVPGHNRGKLKIRTQHYLQCPQCKCKVVKLFLPLCTICEIIDADLVRFYLAQLDQIAPNRLSTAVERTLIDRYHHLFHPRIFRCRQCLCICYGEARGKSGGT